VSRNSAASVHQRLLNLARNEDRRFNEVLQRYALERWLYRLSVSGHADRFVLKGGLLLSAWDLPIYRPTRDIYLLARTPNDLDGVRAMISEICKEEVEPDGLVFDETTVSAERIAEDAVYKGVRSTFAGNLGNARIAMQIDLDFSDVVTPGPIALTIPTILELPAPELQAYNQETTIAEKFEAMVKLGELNSRMKDFFDIEPGFGRRHALRGDRSDVQTTWDSDGCGCRVLRRRIRQLRSETAAMAGVPETHTIDRFRACSVCRHLE
jgi:predicted nucleotidyltransferase component of viral defense system